MKQTKSLDTKKKLVMAAALAGMMAGVTLSPDVSFAGEKGKDAKAEKKADAKCADGSCGEKKEDKKDMKAGAKCADGSCGEKKEDKKDKKAGAKCADGSCGDKK